jgi:hypothetical protein
MNHASLPYLNRYRLTTGPLASTPEYEFNGCFLIPLAYQRQSWTNTRTAVENIKTVCSDGEGWEHVSVSLVDYPHVCPRWEVMSAVKDLFWLPEETVIQIHPPKSQYVNVHPGCLHLWRPIGVTLPSPPTWMIG